MGSGVKPISLAASPPSQSGDWLWFPGGNELAQKSKNKALSFPTTVSLMWVDVGEILLGKLW